MAVSSSKSVRYDTPLRAAALFFLAIAARAHDAPAQVNVHMQARAVGHTMTILVRLPLEAIRDVDFPAIEGGYLDVAALAPRLPGLAKIWVADNISLEENGQRTAAPAIVRTRIAQHSDRSFATFEQAAAQLERPLPPNQEKLFWKQVFFDVALDYPIHEANSAFSLKPSFANLGERVDTVLRYRERSFLLSGDQDSFPLDPTWLQAAWLFICLGFVHILEGADHLLFLLCLVIPCRRPRPLIATVSAFTAAHSVTLIASAVGMAPDGLWFPPFVEFAIALSIVYLALANIAKGSAHNTWLPAFAFGLIHGFGFSFALRESLQFAGSHLPAALLSFNIGVELGQLAALAVMVPVVEGLFRSVVDERIGSIILSALIAHTGWHWMWERGEQLRQYSLAFPAITAAGGALALRWLMLLMLVATALWATRQWRPKDRKMSPTIR